LLCVTTSFLKQEAKPEVKPLMQKQELLFLGDDIPADLDCQEKNKKAVAVCGDVEFGGMRENKRVKSNLSPKTSEIFIVHLLTRADCVKRG